MLDKDASLDPPFDFKNKSKEFLSKKTLFLFKLDFKDNKLCCRVNP
jgi:hypothetical protein